MNASSGHTSSGGPVPVIAASFILGGLLVILFPWHLGTIVRIVVVTVATAAAVSALLGNLPERGAGGWWLSPFTRLSARPRAGPRIEDLDRIREKLTGRRRPLSNGPPLPPETIRLLEGLARDALDRAGLDGAPGARGEPGDAELPPRVRALLGGADANARPRLVRADDRQVAGAVHQILDELDGLTGRSPHPLPSADSPAP